MSGGENDLFLKNTARYLREQEALKAARLKSTGPTTFRDAWELTQPDTKSIKVQQIQNSATKLPSYVDKILSSELRSELLSLLRDIDELNEQFIGMDFEEVRLLLENHDDGEDLSRRFDRWAERYVSERLARPSTRDKGSKVAQYSRIYEELLPSLDTIAFKQQSIHRTILAKGLDYLPWLLFRQTWAPLVRVRFDEHGFTFGLSRQLSREESALCHQALDLYSWCYEEGWRYFWSRFLQDVQTQDEERNVSSEFLNAEMHRMAEDIEEMKPLLVRNFKSEKSLVQVASTAFIAWNWSTAGSIGSLVAHRTERKLIEGIHKQFHLFQLGLDYEGRWRLSVMPWLSPADVGDEHKDRVVRLGHTLLAKVHAKLFSFYEKIDLRSLLTRASPDTGADPSGETSDELVAASCQLYLGEERELPPSPGQARPAIRMVRLQRFLTLLERKLGCQVRDGKGSEVDLYRHGGHHFRLGRHKRNDYVPSVIISRILKRLAISTDELLNALGEQG